MMRLFLTSLLSLLLVLSATSACWSHGWAVTARELVDVQFGNDETLIILVSAPNAVEPGIYRWSQDEAAPSLLCNISSPAAFSFDRKTILERVAGSASELRVYNASTCRALHRVRVEGAILDADARGKYVAIALRTNDGVNELRLYGLAEPRGKLPPVLATATIGRNVELGFAPDGRSVVNFDPSDGILGLWQRPSLASTNPPAWISVGETTFVPGSMFVKRYVADTLSVARWPSGINVYTLAVPRSVRLRQLSTTGRYGVLHQRDDTVEALEWVDFASQKRVRLDAGSIDHAAINSSGSRVAWAQRNHEKGDEVIVRRAVIKTMISADGSVVNYNDLTETRQ